MKSFRDYLKESGCQISDSAVSEEDKKKKTQTKDKENDWSGLDDLFTPKADQPLTRTDPEPEDNQEEPRNTDPRGRAASQGDTLRATRNIQPNDRMRDLLSRMRDIEADDDEGYPEEEPGTDLAQRVDTGNLPAVAGQALQATGTQNPDWHKVSNLPGNMSRAIRSLGKQLFRSFTSTDTNDVHMIGNLGGQGPNSTAEVNAVAGWLRNHGEEVSTGDIDFDTSIPGYRADIKQYRASGIRWLLVRDEFGNYIYTWPESDSLQNRSQAQLTRDTPRLGR